MLGGVLPGVLVGLLVAASVATPLAADRASRSPALVPLEPILIEGDRGFAAHSAHLRGAGTPRDPYVLESAEVDASASRGEAGIELRNTTAHVIIRGVRVHSGYQTDAFSIGGLLLRNASNVFVYSVVSEGNAPGLWILGSRNVSVVGNSFLSRGDSVLVRGSSDVVVSGNLFEGADLSIHDSSRVSLVANSISRTPDPPTGFGIEVLGSQDVQVLSNRVTPTGPETGFAAGRAVVVDGSHRVVLAGNALEDGSGGIVVLDSDDMEIRANRLTRFADSIYVDAYNPGGEYVPMTNLTITENSVTSSWDFGIWVSGADRALVEGNDIRAAYAGIGLFGARNARIASNSVSDVEVAVSVTNSTGNLFYHNVFSDYTEAGWQTFGGNDWNASYPLGGNFWSGYTGVDECSGPTQSSCTGGDGIGDTHFVIDGNASDDFPFMRPLSAPDGPPVGALVAYPPAGERGGEFTLYAGASSDPEDPPAGLEERWDFDGDGVWDTFWSRSLSASRAYSDGGSYAVRLEVRDSAGQVDGFTAWILVTQPGPASVGEGALFGGPLAWGAVSAVAAAAAGFVLLRVRRRRMKGGLPPGT